MAYQFKHYGRLTALAGLLAIASPGFSQQVRQQALGFVLDGTISRVRPLWGAPGAALVGSPVDLGGDVLASAASPGQDFLILLTGTARTARIWTTSGQSVAQIAGVRDGATQVMLSPEGTAAAFYYADTKTVHVVTGLPGSPVASFDADLSALMNPLGSLAVSDDGALVLAAESFVDGNAAPSVAVFRQGGVAGRIPAVGAASAIAFLSKSHDVLISTGSEATLIRDAVAQTSRIALPSAALSASAVLASSDGAKALFVSRQLGTISVVSLTSPQSAPSVVQCSFIPAGIARTAANSVYRITEDAGAPVSLIDISSNQSRLLVIPPAAAAENSPGNQ